MYNLTYFLFSFPAGKLSDRFGRWNLIIAGWLVYSVVYAGMTLTDRYWIWVLFGLYGIYMALTEGVSKALIVDCVPPEKRGAALGLLYMILGFCALSSNVLTGFLWDYFGKSIPFIVGSVTSIAAILLVIISGQNKRGVNALTE